MSYELGKTEDISIPQLQINLQYIFYEKHRRHNKGQSVWIIDFQKEYELAKDSLLNEYKHRDRSSKYYYWNIKKNGKDFLELGKQNNRKEYIGRFELSQDEKMMHGYPIDHTMDAKQIPHQNVLEEWHRKDIISKSELMKISRGKNLV